MKLFPFFILKLYCTFIYAFSAKYCEICSNHTLCLYKNPGPGVKCVGYNQNVILAEDDANAIVDKINERRNFIATGHSKYVPAAANMRKIRWSPELATFAQRWADQCDQSLHPDKEDKCRNLDNINVGQNIATIVGSTTALNIKSFVEIWFMQSMDYRGEVLYYNQSVDNKTNYFTQLIWAETGEVGCGRAKFYIHNSKPVLVERLICNFAPKGNIQGKPVYIVGNPATKCKNNMKPDKTYTSLCITIHLSTKPTQNEGISSPASSFLRIRNLYNGSATPEIDPVQIYHNPKPNIKGYYEINNHNSKLRDLLKYPYDAVKRSYPLENEHFWRFQNNNSRNHAEHYQQQKGHSRVYHGHNHKNEFDLLHPVTPITDSRRFDYTTNTINIFSEKEFRKHNVNNYCTRKDESQVNTATECIPCMTKLKCTRGHRNNCQQSTNILCKGHQPITTFDVHTSALCPCNFQNTFKTSSFMSCEFDHNRNNNCDCADKNWSTKPCQSMLKTLKESDDQLNKQNDFNYYDFHSNLHSSISSMTTKSFYESWITSNNNMQNLHRRRVFPSDRKRSLQEDENNFRPFWQVDEYSNNKQPLLKSIRFTTLSNKRDKSYKKTRKTTRDLVQTEYITIPAIKQSDQTMKRVTEKYLSFDELLHLRKHNSDLSARRANEGNATKAAENKKKEEISKETKAAEENTSEYTANTPYLRKKYCTRKLTCTWTVPSITDSAGSIITGGGGQNGGSRTPPGYVDGCTRTSTCTRDYMNRNKMATLTVEVTSEETVTGDDDDYCERRSLHRRNLHEDVHAHKNIKQVTFLKNETFTQPKPLFNNNTYNRISKNSRKKRHDHNGNISVIFNNHKAKRDNDEQIEANVLSYGDIYYLVSKKIIEMWRKRNESLQHNKVCLCNNVTKFKSNYIMNLIIVTKLFIIKYI